MPGHLVVDGKVQGVGLERVEAGGERLLDPTGRDEEMRAHVMRVGVGRVELDGARQVPLGRLAVPLVVHDRHGQCGMPFGERFVQPNRSSRFSAHSGTPSPTHMEGIIVYLHVAQGGSVLDQAIERVRFAGGDILVPVTEIGPMGQFAVIRDSEGNAVGLHAPR